MSLNVDWTDLSALQNPQELLSLPPLSQVTERPESNIAHIEHDLFSPQTVAAAPVMYSPNSPLSPSMGDAIESPHEHPPEDAYDYEPPYGESTPGATAGAEAREASTDSGLSSHQSPSADLISAYDPALSVTAQLSDLIDSGNLTAGNVYNLGEERTEEMFEMSLSALYKYRGPPEARSAGFCLPSEAVQSLALEYFARDLKNGKMPEVFYTPQKQLVDIENHATRVMSTQNTPQRSSPKKDTLKKATPKHQGLIMLAQAANTINRMNFDENMLHNNDLLMPGSNGGLFPQDVSQMKVSKEVKVKDEVKEEESTPLRKVRKQRIETPQVRYHQAEIDWLLQRILASPYLIDSEENYKAFFERFANKVIPDLPDDDPWASRPRPPRSQSSVDCEIRRMIKKAEYAELIQDAKDKWVADGKEIPVARKRGRKRAADVNEPSAPETKRNKKQRASEAAILRVERPKTEILRRSSM